MRFTRTRNEQGVALITVLMMLTLISAMLVATTALVVKDQRSRFQDHNRTDTFYVAHAGLEKITNDLGRVFSTNYAPTPTELATVTATPPVLGGMKFEIPGGGVGSGYRITKGADNATTITTGSFAGLQGIITPYTIDVTAQSPQRSEVSLRRQVNTVAIPVFQFGIFSETDLSFFPGPQFNFGGRVHTNGNLFLAKGNTDDLILADRVTVFKDVIRHELANGFATATNYNGEVRILTTDDGCETITAATCRPIAMNEGSLNSSNAPNNNWSTISLSTYAGFIKNGANGAARGTGAARLVLPITSGGAPAVELIRRPATTTEDTTNNNLYIQRYYTMASVRILLSDVQNTLDTLPGHSAGNARNLTAVARAAQSTGGYPYTTGTAANPADLVSGFIKVEMQNQAGTGWTDVTDEFLNLGISGPSIGNPGQCTPPTTAIIRLQRVKDAPNTGNCDARTNYWSNTLYDAREGANRDNNAQAGTGIYLGGIMHYVELDIANLRTWLAAKRNTDSIMETTGYVVYFSDRRGNRNAAGNETGEFGFEDVVNTNNTLQTGEDVNGNGTVETYGGVPNAVGTGAVAPFDGSALLSLMANNVVLPGPVTIQAHSIARASKPIFFRRALKLVNGNRTNMLIDTAGRPKLGLTVVAENPVYIQGDYNATTSEGIPTTYTNEHVACAVIADAVTLLSIDWNDRTSFQSPHGPAGRPGVTTTYRTAIVSGKGMNFPQPSGTANDFGTDGGTHNFLRYLEDWNGTLNYRGSIVSLYYNHQATGTYKCCTNVYDPPNRQYFFDDEFLNPALLPPRTPMFRTIDVTNFTRLSEPPTP
jgi:hypothetical protein